MAYLDLSLKTHERIFGGTKENSMIEVIIDTIDDFPEHPFLVRKDEALEQLVESIKECVYCLNEAGIIWFRDTTVTIPIALPEITHENMYGFLNDEYKIRRLDNNDDIAYIYDTIISKFSLPSLSASIITREINKLIEKYYNYINNFQATSTAESVASFNAITTDDERIVLFYILKYKIRRISRDDISAWLSDEEIYNVNVDNAFDLLSSFGNGSNVSGILELDIVFFRDISKNSDADILYLSDCVEKHRKLSRLQYNSLWQNNAFTDNDFKSVDGVNVRVLFVDLLNMSDSIRDILEVVG